MKIENLKYIDKLILVEGDNDKHIFNKLKDKYTEITNTNVCNTMITILDGIDTLADKLNVLSRAYENLVDREIEWILIRDTDCMPISKIHELEEYIKQQIYFPNKTILFQNGYELESVYFSDIDKLCNIINLHYGIEKSTLNSIIQDILQDFNLRVKDVTDSMFIRLSKDFDRQKNNRKEKIFNSFNISDVLKEITVSNIQFIMTKKNIDEFLEILHNKITEHHRTMSSQLNYKNLTDLYISSINDINDFYNDHKKIFEIIFANNNNRNENIS